MRLNVKHTKISVSAMAKIALDDKNQRISQYCNTIKQSMVTPLSLIYIVVMLIVHIYFTHMGYWQDAVLLLLLLFLFLAKILIILIGFICSKKLIMIVAWEQILFKLTVSHPWVYNRDQYWQIYKHILIDWSK